MKFQTIVIVFGTAILTFWLGWFLHDMKQFAEGEIADTKRIDSLRKAKPNLEASKPVITLKNDSSQQAQGKSIGDVTKFIWHPHHPDTTGYLCEIQFEDEYAVNSFHGQCQYLFFTGTTYAKGYQQIELYRIYKTDCLLNMSFLEKSNGIKNFPSQGDAFAIYRLINDTTLSVEYLFPDWVKKVNQIAKDSLFSQRLYLKNE